MSRASQYTLSLKMRGFEKDEDLDAWVRRDESGAVVEPVSREWLATLDAPDDRRTPWDLPDAHEKGCAMADEAETPTTQEVRQAYCQYFISDLDHGTDPDRLAAFDRWLEAHDREVYQQAVRDNL